MRAVRADGEQQLEQEFVVRFAGAELRVAVLAAHLAELARPERQQQRAALVLRHVLVGAAGHVEASAREPAARELVLARDVRAEALVGAALFLRAAPHELTAREQPTVDRAPERPPA